MRPRHPPPLRPPTQPLEAPGENIARSIVVILHGLRLLNTCCVVQGVLAHLEVQLPPRHGMAQYDHVSAAAPRLREAPFVSNLRQAINSVKQGSANVEGRLRDDIHHGHHRVSRSPSTSLRGPRAPPPGVWSVAHARSPAQRSE